MSEKRKTQTESVNSNNNGKVPVQPSETQLNRYNMTLPQSFSIYNDEGSVIYRGEVEQMANRLRAELFGYDIPENPVVEEKESKKESKKESAKISTRYGYQKRRAFFLVLPMVLTLVVIALAVMGLFNLSFGEYISIYNNAENFIPILDPVFSFLKGTFNIELGTMPTTFGDTYAMQGDDFVTLFTGYALPIAIVIYFIFAIIMVIISVVGLARKKRGDGTFAKAKLGFLSIVMFLCAIIIAICGMYIGGVKAEMQSIIDFVTGIGSFTVGYGLFAIIIVPVLTFICTCLTYGKRIARKY